MVKIQLIYPRTDDRYFDTSEFDKTRIFPPPIGLEILSAYLKDIPNIEIEIIDGNMFSMEEIYSSLDCDYLGISIQYSNYENALKIAKHFKEKSPDKKVIFGGPNATILGSLVLANHNYVDFVISGDGEQAFKDLVLNKPLETINNLHFRKNNKIISNPTKPVNMDTLPIFNLENLKKTDNENYNSKKFRSLPLSLIRGCIKSVRQGRCEFCAVPIKGIRVLKPELAWKQVEFLYKKYRIVDFAESGDNFIVGNYPTKLLNAKPNNLQFELSIYANPGYINEGNAEILYKLNVTSVFLGIEHVNEVLLRNVNKFHTRQDSINSVKALEKYGIEVRPTFLYGLPEESKEQANENFEFAKFLVENFSNVTKLLSSVLIPLRGSSLFNKILKNKDLCQKYKNITNKELETDDLIDYKILTALYIENYCKLSISDVKEFINKTLELVPVNKRRTHGMMLD